MSDVLLKCKCGKEYEIPKSPEMPKGLSYVEYETCPECNPGGPYKERYVMKPKQEKSTYMKNDDQMELL